MSYGSSSHGRFCSPSLSPSLQHFLGFIMYGVSWQELIIPGQAFRDPAPGPCNSHCPRDGHWPITLLLPCQCRSPLRFVDSSWWAHWPLPATVPQFFRGGVIVFPLDPWSSRTPVGSSIPCGYPLQPCCEYLESVLVPHLDSPTSWHGTFLSHWILCFFISEARWLNMIVLGLCASVMFKVALFFLKSERLYYT